MVKVKRTSANILRVLGLPYNRNEAPWTAKLRMDFMNYVWAREGMRRPAMYENSEMEDLIPASCLPMVQNGENVVYFNEAKEVSAFINSMMTKENAFFIEEISVSGSFPMLDHGAHIMEIPDGLINPYLELIEETMWDRCSKIVLVHPMDSLIETTLARFRMHTAVTPNMPIAMCISETWVPTPPLLGNFLGPVVKLLEKGKTGVNFKNNLFVIGSDTSETHGVRWDNFFNLRFFTNPPPRDLRPFVPLLSAS
jgi:hypothetical protein